MLVQILILLLTVAAANADSKEYFRGDESCVPRNGCHCKAQWGWNGKMYSGCQLPDDDPNGSWCIIDQNCQFDREDQTFMVKDKNDNHTGDYWQYCNGYYCPLGSGVEQKEECFTTVAGCTCKQDWSYLGGDGNMYNGYKGCANPDNDETGEWCVVDTDSCRQIPPANTHPLYPKQTLETWDRCMCKSKGVITGAKISLPKSSVVEGKVDSDVGVYPPVVIVQDPEEHCDPGVVPRCF